MSTSIRKDFTKGVFYTSIAKYSGIIISLIISSVLARLLTPADFGIVGVATVLISFFNILGDIGIGPAIIQRQNLDKSDINSIHSFAVYLGALLSLIFFFLSPLIADFYERKELLLICRWLCVDIFFTCTNIVPLNLQYKQKRFKSVALITLTVRVTTGIASIFYAYYGGGIYALVLSSILSTFLLAAIYNYISRLKFTIKPKISSLKKILTFSYYQFLFNIINYFSRNLDKLLIGRYIGMSQLGYYEKSYRLMMLPLQNISFVITPVMLPILAPLQNDVPNLALKYFKVLKYLSYISFPLSIILFYCSSELILIIFGEQWQPAVTPFQILTLSIGLQILTSTTGSIYQAVDATKQLFISGCWGAIFMILSFIISISIWHSINAVCIGYLIAQLANSIQCFGLLLKTLDMQPNKLFQVLYRPILISIIIFILMFISPTNIWGENLFISLIEKLSLSGIITLLLIWWIGDINILKLIKISILKRK